MTPSAARRRSLEVHPVPVVKLVVLGEAPPASGGPPLAGPTGERLARLVGLADAEALRALPGVVCRNLLERWPGREVGARGDRFPRELARFAVKRLRLDCSHVLVLGRRVAEALVLRTDYLEWVRFRYDKRAAVLPHPSGVDRWYNEEANRRRAEAFLRTLLLERREWTPPEGPPC